VLTFDSDTGGVWHGCAYSAIAAELLAEAPILTPPAVASGCGRSVCQIRVLRETAPRSHERYGDIEQDAIVDADGTFWCAKRDKEQIDQINMLHVDRGRIDRSDALPVFEWLIGDAEKHISNLNQPQFQYRLVDRVFVRAQTSDWTPLSDGAASAAQ